MVAINNIFKDKEDKEKLTAQYPIDDDPEKADLEAFEVYITPTVLEPRRGYSRTRFCVRLLLLATLLLFGVFLIIGGALIYQRYTTPTTWYKQCGVRYRSPQKGYLIDNGGLYADKMIDKPIFKPKETVNDENNGSDDDDLIEVGELKQDISLNLTNQVEEIKVPDNSIYKRATFMHDFLKNWSVIYDVDTNKCYIFALDRNKISPPKDLFDMILKTMNRYYLPENVLLHQKMMVDHKIEDLTDYGDNVMRTCNKAESYLLKKKQNLIGENHNIDKRSVEKRCEYASNFIESGGKFTLAYHIVC